MKETTTYTVAAQYGYSAWVVIPNDPTRNDCELHMETDVELKGYRKVQAERFGDSTIRASHKVRIITREEAMRMMAEYENKRKAEEEANAVEKERRAAKEAQAAALAGTIVPTSWGASWSINDRAELLDEYGNFMDFVPKGITTPEAVQAWFIKWVAERDAEGWEGVGY